MITNKDIFDFIDSSAPCETQYEWDNSGFLVGDLSAEVKRVAFALDLTKETLENAKCGGATLLVTHHPAIFSGMKSFLSDSPVFDAAVSGISVISAHTSLDCAVGGVNDVLSALLELKAFHPVQSSDGHLPMVRIGVIENEMSGESFASFTAKKLKTTVRFIDGHRSVKRVAVCGGSGMSFLDDVISAGADTFVTGDIKHHEMLEGKEKNINIIAAGHFETEFPAMRVLADNVKKAFGIDAFVVDQENPVRFIV